MRGKVALVTGGSRGIGRAIVLQFAQLGADVVINYVRHRRAAEETAQAAAAHGVRTLVVKAHVGDPAKVEAMFRSVAETFGGLDVLVHNAASGVNRRALELDADGFDWAMNVNARALLLCAQHAVPLMERRGGGVIVAISSIGSQRVLPYYTGVGASKAAIEALVRYLAVELAPRNVVVNAVSPGAVQTEALEHFPDIETTVERLRARTPAGRLVTPPEIASLVAYLCSPAASMIRGQVITIDGGESLVTV
ncbi:MAG: enoyl-[acyl-carrier-protein] reductase FabL [Clostridia bacterium]|nr:enoyl-[acyl-carrier-protein] reductase FabL [Clostridia bacterium]